MPRNNRYLCKMERMNMLIFASGAGSNAAVLMDYFQGSSMVQVVALVSNNADSSALDEAKRRGVKSNVFANVDFLEGNEIVSYCRDLNIHVIVLAGFLRKLPLSLIREYPDRIINIHPSILPNFGGKGMYGRFVHEAVIESNEGFSGITVHLVNEEYDKGQFLAQLYVAVSAGETPESLGKKVQKLEHRYFPMVIEDYLKGV